MQNRSNLNFCLISLHESEIPHVTKDGLNSNYIENLRTNIALTTVTF